MRCRRRRWTWCASRCSFAGHFSISAITVILMHHSPKQAQMLILCSISSITPQRCGYNIKHLVLYAGQLYQPFWTIKIRPGRQEGPKTAKIGYFWRYKYSHFWLFLASPADPLKFLWFKMAGTGVPHVLLHILCWSRTSRGYFRPQKSVLAKIIFAVFELK